MPVTSIGGLGAWGVYLVAALVLLFLLKPSLSTAALDSREGVDLRNLDGVRAVLSSLGPGLVARFSFGATNSDDPILIRGHLLSCSYGGGSLLAIMKADASAATLYPDVSYVASLVGGMVVVTRAG